MEVWDFKSEDRSSQDLAVDKRANMDKLTENDGHLDKLLSHDAIPATASQSAKSKGDKSKAGSSSLVPSKKTGK